SLISSRIDPDLAEIKRARIDRAGARPFLSAIFGAKHAAAFTAQIGQLTRTAFITLHHGHDDLRIARADRESDATSLRWQSSSKFLPTRAAFRAFENAANILAVRCVRPREKAPRCALPRIKRRINNFRIAWIEKHVAAACARIVWRWRLQNKFPSLAAVSCLKQSAFAAVGPKMTAC